MNSGANLKIENRAREVGHALITTSRKLVTAESCTGGWIAKVLTDIPGSSKWFAGGAVAYSNSLKEAMLGVAAETLAAEGAVSEAVAREMSEGAIARLGGDIAVAVTGIAGPDGGTAQKPVGTVWFAWSVRDRDGVATVSELASFPGDREAVRRATVAHALQRILSL